MFQLPKRLEAVASYVSEGAIVADIGSDHALLPCFLVLTHRINKAYAGEVIVGPLQQSKKSIDEYKLSSFITPILSDGLENIPEDTTEIVIAGMGAYTILDILKAYPNKVKKYNKIIVQANSHMEEIRKYISKQHFQIINETIVYEKEKYYEICVFIPRNGRDLSENEITYGPIHLKEKSQGFIDYYQNLIKVKKQILQKIENTSSKYKEIEDEIQKIDNVIKS